MSPHQFQILPVGGTAGRVQEEERERLNFSVKLATLHERTDILIITCCPIAPQSAPLATQAVAW